MAQVATHPPRFVLFVNFPELMVDSYKKYMINQFREEYSFKGVPLVFDLRGKHQRDLDEPTVVVTKHQQGRQEPKDKVIVDDGEVDEEFDLDALPDLQEEVDPSYFS